MKLVKFNNGKYGVRTKWFFGWYFVSLSYPTLSWGAKRDIRKFCQGTKEEAIQAIAFKQSMKTLNSDCKYTIVKY